MEGLVFILAVVPLAWGYLLARRTLDEHERWLSLSLAYALGLLSFLAGVNASFHVLSLRASVFATLGVLAAGAVAVAFLSASRSTSRPLRGAAGPLLTVLVLTAFFEALFWQMQWSDDDFFMHGPLMALTLRNVFPVYNPFFPALPLQGHYGRDLAISALSVLFGERFLAVQYFVTAANQAAAALILHGTARRFLRSPSQALWATFFAFAGINFDSRRGLLETFQNNNSFAFLFLFVNLYLFLTALARRSWPLTVLSGLALGTYALIYETSWGLLCLTFALFPVLLCSLRRRWRLRYFTITASILLLSGALALVQGGLVTEAAKRHFSPSVTHESPTGETRRMTHDLELRLPKPGFRITAAFKGDEYPVWSPRLAEEAGMFVPLLPLFAVLIVVSRKSFGLIVCTLGMLAILIPAGVDFGAFNTESLRFLLVGGVCAAVLLGIGLGMIWDRARMMGRSRRATMAVGLAAAAALSFWPSAKFAYQVLRGAANYPYDRYLVAEEWGCTPVLPQRPCEPIDVSAAVALRPLVRPGDRILTQFKGDDVGSVMLAQATFMTVARGFLTGPGLRVLRAGNYSQSTAYWDAAGFRARAFFATGDVTILDDLGARYVYLDPDSLAPGIYQLISDNPRLERVLHLETPDGLASREVYRVTEESPAFAWGPVSGYGIRSVEVPPHLEPRAVYPVRLVMSGSGGADRPIRISYEIRAESGQIVTQGDEVRLSVSLKRLDGAEWIGVVALAMPYDPGNYEVHLYGWEEEHRVELLDVAGRPVIFRVRST